jgi:hypothetical protein
LINNQSFKKKCACGNTVDDPVIAVKTRYSKLGWIMLSLAFSAKPLEVVYQCQTCGEIIERSTDPVILEKYRYNSDIIK